MRFEPLIALPCMVTGVWRRFGVHVFEGRCTVEDMRLMESSGDAWMRRHPGKLVELVIIHPSEAGMTSEERSRMQRIIKRWEAHRTAAATVILADGLLGSLQRSILTGLLMVVPPPHPQKVFGDADRAIDFLAPHARALCGDEASPAALKEGVAALTTEFMSRPVRATTRG